MIGSIPRPTQMNIQQNRFFIKEIEVNCNLPKSNTKKGWLSNLNECLLCGTYFSKKEANSVLGTYILCSKCQKKLFKSQHT